jgi:hypothetical protein
VITFSIQNSSDDIFAKVTIDQTGTGELGGISFHDISEFTLVVIESQGVWVIYGANIDDNLTSC